MSRQNPQKARPAPHIILDYRIYHYHKVSSTNKVAKKIAKSSDEEKVVILAETQTHGKGRLGRQWFSPNGGLWLSLMLRPQITLREASKLTLIASCAVARTIDLMFGLKTDVKWPNDVLVNGKKICGILTETGTKDGSVEFVIVGVGINANIDMKSFPEGLQDTATSLKHELGFEINRKKLVKNFLQSFDQRYRRLQVGLWSVLLQEWKNLAIFLGRRVEVKSFDEVLVGKALDIDEDGGLIIRLENGVLRKVIAGDVTLQKKV